METDVSALFQTIGRQKVEVDMLTAEVERLKALLEIAPGTRPPAAPDPSLGAEPPAVD